MEMLQPSALVVSGDDCSTTQILNCTLGRAASVFARSTEVSARSSLAGKVDACHFVRERVKVLESGESQASQRSVHAASRTTTTKSNVKK